MQELKAIHVCKIKKAPWKYESGCDDRLSELILGLSPANERRRYKVMQSLIGWVQT